MRKHRVIVVSAELRYSHNAIRPPSTLVLVLDDAFWQRYVEVCRDEQEEGAS